MSLHDNNAWNPLGVELMCKQMEKSSCYLLSSPFPMVLPSKCSLFELGLSSSAGCKTQSNSTTLPKTDPISSPSLKLPLSFIY